MPFHLFKQSQSARLYILFVKDKWTNLGSTADCKITMSSHDSFAMLRADGLVMNTEIDHSAIPSQASLNSSVLPESRIRCVV